MGKSDRMESEAGNGTMGKIHLTMKRIKLIIFRAYH